MEDYEELLTCVNSLSDSLLEEQELSDMYHDRFVKWKTVEEIPPKGKEIYICFGKEYYHAIGQWSGKYFVIDDTQCGGSFLCEPSRVNGWIYLPEEMKKND